MKKVFKVVMAFAGVLMFAGCGSSGNQAGEEQAELTIWGDADNQAVHEDAFTKLNEAFEKENPDIKINYQYSGTLDSINVALQSDSLPDLFWVQGNKSTKMEEMAANGYLLEIEGLDYDRFSEEEIEYATVDGKIYCSLPSFISYVTFFYNKDIFEEHDLEEPETWDDFIEIVNTLSGTDVTPIALGGNGDFDRYWYIQATAASLATDDIDSIVEDKSAATFEELREVFQNFSDFSSSNAFGKDFVSTDGNGAKLLFTNGQAAMIPDGTWNAQSYFESGMNIGTFAMPDKEGQRYAQTGPSNINTYAISSKTEHPEEATKYIEFLNSKKAQQIIADETGEVPALDDVEAKDNEVADLAKFDDIGANIYNKLSQAATETSKPQDLILTSLLPDLMTGKIDADEAIELLKTELAK